MIVAALIAEIRAGLDHAEAGIEHEFAQNGPSPRYFYQMQALLEVRAKLLAEIEFLCFEKLPSKSEAPHEK